MPRDDDGKQDQEEGTIRDKRGPPSFEKKSIQERQSKGSELLLSVVEVLKVTHKIVARAVKENT